MAAPVLLIEAPLPGCVQIVLNRPEARNALSRDLRRELVLAIDELAASGQTRVLIITGAGDAFCAGLDLAELGSGRATESLAVDDLSLNPIAALQRFPGVVIGAINGVAISGGLEIALACDLVICSRGARFADTHVRIGVMPFWGLSQRLSRAIGLCRAKEISLTGNFLSAERADAWGLVNRVVDIDRLLPEVRQLAAEMLSAVPETLAAYKKTIDTGYSLALDAGLAEEKRAALASHRTADFSGLERRCHSVRARGQEQIDRV